MSQDALIFAVGSMYTYREKIFESNWQLKLKAVGSIHVRTKLSVSTKAYISTEGVIMWGEKN